MYNLGKGYSNLLNDDKDKYAIALCSEKKWVVIGLSEDILISNVIIANYEKYSSRVKVCMYTYILKYTYIYIQTHTFNNHTIRLGIPTANIHTISY